MKSLRDQNPTRALRRHIAAGVAAVVLLLGGVGGWAATTEISGAVIAPGILAVEGNSKQVQHPLGGVVAELSVSEGQRVEEGDVLLRLDATVARANLAVVTKALNQLYARKARLEAERDELTTVVTPAALIERLGSERADEPMSPERRLFADRRAFQSGQRQRLAEQMAQIDQKVRGYEAQQTAKTDEIALIEKELQGVRSLFQRGLASVDRLNNLARSAARLRGESGLIVSSIAEARQKQAEIGVQLLQIDQAQRSEVSTELRDLEGKEGELVEREASALDQLRRIDITAPVSGVINQLSIHTVGGVIRPAETLMQIVPQNSRLVVEARIVPQDVDQIAIGQTVVLRLSSLNRNTTPEIMGTVDRLSADLVTDERTGAGFFRVGIGLLEEERTRIVPLVAGMPVEAFIRTGDRTVLSYLSKPIRDRVARTFRED